MLMRKETVLSIKTKTEISKIVISKFIASEPFYFHKLYGNV